MSDRPICFDCRFLDLKLEKGRTYHWCTRKAKKLSDRRVTLKACRHFEAWPPLLDAPWP